MEKTRPRWLSEDSLKSINPSKPKREVEHLLRERRAVVLALALVTLTAGCKRAPSGDSQRKTSATHTTATPDAHPTPTYWKHIAPILDASCTKCHARGGIGPMPLTTYADARENAPRIAAETKARKMPPWLPDTSACATLEHPRMLSQHDVDTLSEWAAGGMPEGNVADRPPAITSAPPADTRGAPDLTATPDEAYMPKRGQPEDYHCFVISPKLAKNESINALRVVPGEGAIVHHALLYEVRGKALEEIQALDAAEPGPGFSCFGGIGPAGLMPSERADKPGEFVATDRQLITVWTPGSGATDVAGAPSAFPKGTAIHITAGSTFVLQVHYSLENYRAGMTDRTRVEMWFAKGDEALRQARWLPIEKTPFSVPPGAGPDDPRAKAWGVTYLPSRFTVLGVVPHMHLRGRSMRLEAIDEPNGKTMLSCLLDVPRWDFHHQEAYWLQQGVPLRRAVQVCKWDNRDEAQPLANGHRRPAKTLEWGLGTDDEMCLAYLYTVL